MDFLCMHIRKVTAQSKKCVLHDDKVQKMNPYTTLLITYKLQMRGRSYKLRSAAHTYPTPPRTATLQTSRTHDIISTTSEVSFLSCCRLTFDPT